MFPELEIERLSEEKRQHPSHRNLSAPLENTGKEIVQKIISFGQALVRRGGPIMDDLRHRFDELLLLVANYKTAHLAFEADWKFHNDCWNVVSSKFWETFRGGGDFLAQASTPAAFQERMGELVEGMGRAELDSFIHIASTQVADESWRAEHSERPSFRSPGKCCIRNFAIAVYLAYAKKRGWHLSESAFTHEDVSQVFGR